MENNESQPIEGQTQLFGGDGLRAAPVRPYAGTIGHAGSDTSEARAEREPAGERQAVTIRHLENHEAAGVTVRQLREWTGWHHGTASGVLSVLHRSRVIVRLAEVRDGCKVYVLPVYVDGRPTESPGRTVGALADCKIRRRGFTDVVAYDGVEYLGAADLVRALRGES